MWIWLARIFGRQLSEPAAAPSGRGGRRRGAGRKPKSYDLDPAPGGETGGRINAVNPRHPITLCIEEYARGRSWFRAPNPALDRMVQARTAYSLKSISSVLYRLRRAGIVERLAPGKFRWIGFPQADAGPAECDAQPELLQRPLSPNAALHLLKSATDGLTVEEIIAKGGAARAQVVAAIAVLVRDDRAVEIGGRLYATKYVDAVTRPPTAARPRPH